MSTKANRKRWFFEPWIALKGPGWESPYKFGPPKHGDTPEDVTQNVSDWEARKAKAEREADWIIFGSKMVEPGVVKNIGCPPEMSDDKGIIAVRRKLYTPEGSPTQEHICKRIVECVNALAGVGDPAKFISDVRWLLHGYATGECVEDPRTDSRVISLLSRCLPPEQLEKLNGHDD